MTEKQSATIKANELYTLAQKLGIGRCLVLMFNFLFYRLEHIDTKTGGGYFLVKRRWAWVLIAPIYLPLYMLSESINAVFKYYKYINTYRCQWIRDSKKKLTLREKINYRIQLWD